MLSKILERVPKEKQEVIKQCLDDNNSKMVLLSIRKCWLDKIATGEKTLELRKSAPKGIQFPFAVLCYESKTDGGCGKVKGILLVGGIRKIGKNAFLPMYTNNPESEIEWQGIALFLSMRFETTWVPAKSFMAGRLRNTSLFGIWDW